MTKEEAEKYAKNMTYCEAIHNLKQAKSVPYRKATFTKINELLDELEQEPFMNKVCVSSKVCEHDKEVVLGKIRAEIEQNAYPIVHGVNNHELGMTLHGILQVIDKYKAESEKTVEE